MCAETNITVGQRTKPGHKYHVTDALALRSDIMAGRKLAVALLSSASKALLSSTSTSSSTDTEPAKKAKRQVAVSTFEKWQRN